MWTPWRFVSVVCACGGLFIDLLFNFPDSNILFSHITVGGLWGLLRPKSLNRTSDRRAVKGFWFQRPPSFKRNSKVWGVTVPSFSNDMLNAKQGGHVNFHLWHKTNIGPWMVIPLPFLVISSLFKGGKAKPVRQGLVCSNLRIIKSSKSVRFMSTYLPGGDSNSVQCWDKVEM